MNKSSTRFNFRSAASHAGFTLVEIMVTVAIVGILAAIAIPTYRDSVQKSNRGMTQSYMMDLAQREQQYLTENRTYSTAANTLLTIPDKVTTYYDIQVTVTTDKPPTFTITATPKAGTAQANDVVLTLTNAGAKTPTDKW